MKAAKADNQKHVVNNCLTVYSLNQHVNIVAQQLISETFSAQESFVCVCVSLVVVFVTLTHNQQ